MNALKLIRHFLKTDFGTALIVTLVWKVVISVIGYIIDLQSGGATSFFDHTIRWDAGWYTSVITDHYAHNLASAAFYPLFPLVVGLVNLLSFNSLGIPLAGQLVNTIAVWFILVALIKLARNILGENKKYLFIALVLSAPAAFFMHVFYSEAVFMALSFWAYYYALKRNWLGVGILLALLTAARLPSILVIALCGLEFMRAYDWKWRQFFNKNVLYFLLAPIGFIAFAVYLSFIQHDPLGMFHAYQHTDDWAYQVFNPNIFETILSTCYQIPRVIMGQRLFNSDFIVNALLPVASLILLGMCSLYLLIKHRKSYLPLGVVGLLSIIMFTLNSNVVSVHRYVLPSLTIYVAVGLFVRRFKRPCVLYAICAIGVLIQVFLLYLFVNNRFAG